MVPKRTMTRHMHYSWLTKDQDGKGGIADDVHPHSRPYEPIKRVTADLRRETHRGAVRMLGTVPSCKSMTNEIESGACNIAVRNPMGLPCQSLLYGMRSRLARGRWMTKRHAHASVRDPVSTLNRRPQAASCAPGNLVTRGLRSETERTQRTGYMTQQVG